METPTLSNSCRWLTLCPLYPTGKTRRLFTGPGSQFFFKNFILFNCLFIYLFFYFIFFKFFCVCVGGWGGGGEREVRGLSLAIMFKRSPWNDRNMINHKELDKQAHSSVYLIFCI